MIFHDDDRTFFKTLKVADYENLFIMIEEMRFLKTEMAKNKFFQQ